MNKGGSTVVPKCHLFKVCTILSTVILSWFVDCQIKEAVLAGKRLVEEEDVEMKPERISAWCLDENVCIPSIQKYFSEDAWAALTQVLEVVRKNAVWYYGTCSKVVNDDTENSVVCDSCLSWFHFNCVALKTCPKSKQWFCLYCHEHKLS